MLKLLRHAHIWHMKVLLCVDEIDVKRQKTFSQHIIMKHKLSYFCIIKKIFWIAIYEYYLFFQRKMVIFVLRSPVRHCELNPIELIWAQMKRYVACRNNTFRMKDVQKLTMKSFNPFICSKAVQIMNSLSKIVYVKQREELERFNPLLFHFRVMRAPRKVTLFHFRVMRVLRKATLMNPHQALI